MFQSFYSSLLSITGLFILFSCHESPENHPSDPSLKSGEQNLVTFRGNLSTSKYDSIVNVLTLHQDETFELHQVDRIAEHHLHERDHNGIYTYLTDSTQLALYTEDGILMLRFLLKDEGLIPMTLSGDRIPDSTYIWKKQPVKIMAK